MIGPIVNREHDAVNLWLTGQLVNQRNSAANGSYSAD